MENELPEFPPGAIIIFRGETLKAMRDAKRTNRPCCDHGLTIVSQMSGQITLAATNSGGGGVSADPGEEIPEFKEGKLYLPTKETLAALLRPHHTRTASDGVLSTTDTADGVLINAN